MAGETHEDDRDCSSRRGGFDQVTQAPSPSPSDSDEEMSDLSSESGSSSRSRASAPSPPAPALVQWQPDHDTLSAIFTTTWNNFDDTELQHLILRRYMETNVRGRPSMDDVRESAINILRLIGPRLTPREAIILLLQAGLNQALAVQQWMQLSHSRLATAVAEARDPPSAKEVAKARTERVQALDDKLPIPDDLDILEVDWRGAGKARAVYHFQIRKYLIERDIKKFGRYRYKRNHGRTFEDQTAPHPDQLMWRFDKRGRLPDILLVYKGDTRINPDYEVPDMYWRGLLVIDTDRNALLDYRHLPSTLAGNAEGGLLEALERMDGRVRHQDLAARHFVPNPITRPDLRDLKNRDNKLAQQMRRWRERWCCVSWASRRTGTDVFLNYIDNLLPQELKDRNTTRGWRKLYRDEVAEVKGMNVGNFPNRSATKDLSKRQKYIDAETRKRERLMELARKRRALEAQGIRPSESEHESEEEQQTASEGEEDDESKGPDSRRDRPATAEEEQELHEAMLPTILHFLNLTGELPVVDSWSRRYLLIHWDLHWQLQIALGRSDRQRVPSLVGYGRWTGGISGWRTATLITDPTKD